MALVKTLTRVVVIGGLATGAAVVVAGPQRVGALFHQARATVISGIDNVIEDPILLREQLSGLLEQYPDRIAEVRSELIDVREQVAGLEREADVARKVVDLADADLAHLQPLIERAELARAESPSAVVRVRFERETVSLEDLYARATQARTTKDSYANRAAQADRNVELLAQQDGRLGDLLTRLETEHAELQAQLFQLNAEIDMLARNERLIDMTERRQKTIDRFERFDAVSLGQVQSRISKIRAEQDARLESLTKQREVESYEERAKTMLDAEASARMQYEAVTAPVFDAEPEPITIDAEDEPITIDADRVAAR